MTQIRLDKCLADAGIGTRSQVKSYIKKGAVEINGVVATRPEQKVDLDADQVTYNNELLSLSKYEYYLLNKPAGYVSATKDNTAPTVLSLLSSTRKDLFPVGRLDKDTEGFLLITNDGELSHRLLSPKKHVNKTYYAVLDHSISQEDIERFSQGLPIGDEDLDVTMPATLCRTSPDSDCPNNLIDLEEVCHVHITIQEGKYHQVKRMFQFVGNNVLYLKRVAFGNMTLPKDLPLGSYKTLSMEDIQSIL